MHLDILFSMHELGWMECVSAKLKATIFCVGHRRCVMYSTQANMLVNI